MSSPIQNHAEKAPSGEMMQQVLPFALIRGETVVEKPQDLFIPPDALEIILESFEGPLDLLLYLIRKQKFDILDLPIAPITAQYMTYVELMKNIKLELAAEYLVMAAILAEIKSRLLLPKQTTMEEEDDPRAELVRRLQEYEVIKVAAVNLDELPRQERDVFYAQAALVESFEHQHLVADVELSELHQALAAVLKRTQAFEHHHIQRESLSTRERMAAILEKFQLLDEKIALKNIKQEHTMEVSELTAQTKDFIAFSDFFNTSEGRSGVVVTFLAILELIKEGLLECVQTKVFGELHIRLNR